MQLSNIRTRVRSYTGIRSAALLTDAEIDEYVNEFNRSICEQYSWPQMVGRTIWTATGAPSFTLNADVRNVIALSTEGTHHLIPAVSVGTREADNFTTNLNGVPAKYYENPATRNVKLWPVPPAGTKIVVDYQKNPTTLVNATDAPPFDAEYHLAWVLGPAARILLDRGGDKNKAAELGARTGEIVSRMRRRYLMGRDREAVNLSTRW